MAGTRAELIARAVVRASADAVRAGNWMEIASMSDLEEALALEGLGAAYEDPQIGAVMNFLDCLYDQAQHTQDDVGFGLSFADACAVLVAMDTKSPGDSLLVPAEVMQFAPRPRRVRQHWWQFWRQRDE